MRPTLMPPDTPDDMIPAWIACISWAVATQDVLTWFRKDTGNGWEPSRDPQTGMIHKRCWADRTFIEAFIAWANVNVWGSNEAE